MEISLIAALTDEHLIGHENNLPWYLPADLAWFKHNTLNKPVIMGRKTFESIGRPLPNRLNIVLSRQQHQVENNQQLIWVNHIDQALQACSTENEVMVIGGGHIYQQFIHIAHKLYLTYVDAKVTGDTYFPTIHTDEWQITWKESHQADKKNQYNYCFQRLERKKIT